MKKLKLDVTRLRELTPAAGAQVNGGGCKNSVGVIAGKNGSACANSMATA